MNKEIETGAFIDLFSGIGGFALAAFRTRLRFTHHYFSEVDDFAVGVYRKRFPQAESLGDVRDIDWGKFDGRASLICGGFPCQPHSIAGRRRGGADERDLWTECARALRDLRPAVALFENVPALLVSDGGRFFNRVLSDISASGYDAEWQIISAGEAGAPHLRKRLWLVAYPAGERWGASQQEHRDVDESSIEKPREWEVLRAVAVRDYQIRHRENYADVFCRSDDGLPARVDGRRVRVCGNAIVPQVAEWIFRLPAFDGWRKKEVE